jgi:hypothetical protein
MTLIERILERPLNDHPMRFRDKAQCFLFFLTCLYPAIRASFIYLRRILPPMTFTPMGFKYGNNERVEIYVTPFVRKDRIEKFYGEK